MKKRWMLAMLIASVIIYAAFCIRGWLGVEEINRRNQDNTYWAAVYSRSKLFTPFMKTHDVLIPSKGDLNSHTVFETYGFNRKVDVEWLDSENLQITCQQCNRGSLLSNKIDNINIRLINQ
jgi:hypothetical protein